MSWLIPHAEEPSHKDFVFAWVRNKTVFQVSAALAELGYVDMTPDICLEWANSLRSAGAKLPARPFRK